MDKQKIIEQVAEYVEQEFSEDTSGHDWWHIYRVWKMAQHIGQAEKADMFIVELGALLHDIADFKFHDGDETIGAKKAAEVLEKFGADAETIEKVVHIVDNVSFKGAKVENKMKSLEGKIAQDADRLDAIGAIGAVRAIAYGASKGRPIYIPGEKPKEHSSFEEYKKGAASSITHFYEKLLHVKDLMNTETGKKIAEGRHQYLENFLEQFHAEWEGKK